MKNYQPSARRQQGAAHEDPPKTESMRNFLLFCLTTDYRFSSRVDLKAADRCKYLDIWDMLTDLRHSHNKTNLTESERSILAPNLWMYSHRPCKRLLIPVESVVVINDNFVRFKNR
jgi:hypothetical protein